MPDFASERGPMSQDIPFDKSFDLAPGRIETVMPGVRRLLVNNPGPFAFEGTLTYISGTSWTIEAVTTPGHTANHMAFALKGTPVLFSGDHVMAWSTPVVAPPDGAMSDYMASLEKLARRAETLYFPGHGGAVRDAPRFVERYIRHRRAREESILRRLGKGEADIASIVRAIYIGLDPRLLRAAGLSVLAHLEDPVARGSAAPEAAPYVGA